VHGGYALSTQQLAMFPINKRLYHTATRFVRPARRNADRQRDIRACMEFFPEGSGWRQAVELACQIQHIEL